MSDNQCQLSSFCIFNSTLGPLEGQEDKKVLYYYPEDVNAGKRKMDIGLCEAIVKFMAIFSSDDCEALHTQKTKCVLYQPEKDYWMVMTVNVPFIEKTSGDGTKYYEYFGEQVQSNVLESILMTAHRMFRFFMGSFSSLPIDVLKIKLKKFFYPYLLELKLQHCDISDVFQGVQYLPLDRFSFLKVQCFVNVLETEIPEIKQSVFLYNDQLIWNGISPNDVQIVYKHLVDTLLPAHIEKELQGGPHVSAQHFGCFVSPPNGFRDESDLKRISKVYLNNETNVENYYFVVYRALAATVCLFIDGNTDLTIDLMHKIDTFASPQLTSLASEIGEQCKKESSPMNNPNDPSVPKYIYFNHLNVAYKSTIHQDNRHTGNIEIKSDVLKLIADISSDRKCLEKYGEVTIKTSDDYWVIGKISNRREFYVVVQRKNVNLKEVHEDVKKLLETKLKSIFFYPI